MQHDEDFDDDITLYDYDEVPLKLAVNLLTGIDPSVCRSIVVSEAIDSAAKYAAHRFKALLADETETTELGREMVEGMKEVTGDN